MSHGIGRGKTRTQQATTAHLHIDTVEERPLPTPVRNYCRLHVEIDAKMGIETSRFRHLTHGNNIDNSQISSIRRFSFHFSVDF